MINKVLKSVAKIGLASAKKSSNQFSWAGCYQKKEPEALKKLSK